MSNSVRKVFHVASVPQVAGATVPAALRQVIGVKKPSALAAALFAEVPNLSERNLVDLLAVVKTAGGHATITVTIEGSDDASVWYALQLGLGPLVAGLTANGNGVSGAVALFQGGLVLRVPGGWSYYRVGIAGDAAASGTADVGLRAARLV